MPLEPGELDLGVDWEARRVQPPPTASTPGRRRIERQRATMLGGLHPLSVALRVAIPLHPGAPAVDDRAAAGPRCGDCAWRQKIGAAPKCLRPGDDGTPTPRLTFGAGTDVRAWWPGCSSWTPATVPPKATTTATTTAGATSPQSPQEASEERDR